jgi:hypothetical protein
MFNAFIAGRKFLTLQWLKAHGLQMKIESFQKTSNYMGQKTGVTLHKHSLEESANNVVKDGITTSIPISRKTSGPSKKIKP